MHATSARLFIGIRFIVRASWTPIREKKFGPVLMPDMLIDVIFVNYIDRQ